MREKKSGVPVTFVYKQISWEFVLESYCSECFVIKLTIVQQHLELQTIFALFVISSGT